MRRALLVLGAVLATGAIAVPAALAVSRAHFVGTPTLTQADDTLIVSGKVAGLGNVDVITVTISGDALCINNGGKHPRAVNKADVTGGADVPVQNGKANFSVESDPVTFQPECSPPMTVEFRNVTVTVTAADGTNLVFRF
jgi:hypothetical protein